MLTAVLARVDIYMCIDTNTPLYNVNKILCSTMVIRPCCFWYFARMNYNYALANTPIQEEQCILYFRRWTNV